MPRTTSKMALKCPMISGVLLPEESVSVDCGLCQTRIGVEVHGSWSDKNL